MNKIKNLSLFIIIVSKTLSMQASSSCNEYNESSPLVTFNEKANQTVTYTPDSTYQKALQENMAMLQANIKKTSILSYNAGNVEKRKWANIQSKRTSDYPFLLQQQKEIKSLKDEINYNKKIINLMMIGLAGTTATCFYLAYICNCNEIKNL